MASKTSEKLASACFGTGVASAAGAMPTEVVFSSTSPRMPPAATSSRPAASVPPPSSAANASAAARVLQEVQNGDRQRDLEEGSCYRRGCPR